MPDQLDDLREQEDREFILCLWRAMILVVKAFAKRYHLGEVSIIKK